MAAATAVEAAANIRIHAADLFLLERWDHDSRLSADEQRTAIFGEFVRIGIHGRYPYVEQVNQRFGRRLASSLSPHEQALLASVRSPHERTASQYIWLRTCYRDLEGNTTDGAHDAIFKGSWMQQNAEKSQIFNDSTLYDFGQGGWQRIFTRIPELVENASNPESFDKRKAEAIEEALQAEAEEDVELEEQDYSKSEDGTHWSDRYDYYQYTSVVGAIWVADEETLCKQQGDGAKLLIAWFDDCGRVVRWNRMAVGEIESIMGLMFNGCDRDHPAWSTAEIGKDYDWEGVCGPPYEAGKGDISL